MGGFSTQPAHWHSKNSQDSLIRFMDLNIASFDRGGRVGIVICLHLVDSIYTCF
jgi:hypothetical protein